MVISPMRGNNRVLIEDSISLTSVRKDGLWSKVMNTRKEKLSRGKLKQKWMKYATPNK